MIYIKYMKEPIQINSNIIIQFNKGFTLIELAIVITIIGLLLVGVIQAQSLIRSSETNSVVSEAQSYISAINIFKSKYNSLPGDMSNATQFWGTASGGCPSGSRSGTETCNGNGDSKIYLYPGTSNEGFMAWQHLANAQLIKGSYTGFYGSYGQYSANIAINIPASKMKGSGFTIAYTDPIYSNEVYPVALNKNQLWFGVAPNACCGWTVNNSLTIEEAKIIDTKTDDGIPSSGFWTVDFYYSPSCVTSNTAPAAYNSVALTGNRCAFLIDIGY
jgi:prepilin-type N-terminal cleavage/methylation domain-containing protein